MCFFSKWKIIVSLAVCLILLISAVQFFNDQGLPADGDTGKEINAVCWDIMIKSVIYSEAAEATEDSLVSNSVSGFELQQEDPTPEDVKNLWNTKNYNGWFFENESNGIHYECRWEDDPDNLQSYLEKHDGDALVWSVEISEFWLDGYFVVSDGVIAYGGTDVLSNANVTYAWMSKIDENGSVLWTHKLNNGFKRESIAAILENNDGSYAVISRGDLNYFCLSQYTVDGKVTHFQKTEVGNYGIWDAACFGDGYIVQLGSFMQDEYATVAMVDHGGNITRTFSYDSEDTHYHITDMIEFDGRIYLSAYAVPKLAEGEQSYGGRYEIAPILGYLYENEMREISSEELTPMVRERYTAMLLVCDPDEGTPQEFYSVKGSLGGTLELRDDGTLLWNVESITTTFYSPGTSSFTIGGTCYVHRHTFDAFGAWVGLEKTDDIIDFRR